jgi:hypothetical protein
LRSLIATGKGQPNPKEGEAEFNEELIKKWIYIHEEQLIIITIKKIYHGQS